MIPNYSKPAEGSENSSTFLNWDLVFLWPIVLGVQSLMKLAGGGKIKQTYLSVESKHLSCAHLPCDSSRIVAIGVKVMLCGC